MQTIKDIDFLQFIGKQESQYILPASYWIHDIKDEFTGANGKRGLSLPWSKTHSKVSLRPGEVSIWGGYNGHGKSEMLSMVCGWGLSQAKWLIASMEMPPRKTMKRMICQVVGTTDPTSEYIDRFMGWTDEKLWIYDQTDTVKFDRILGMVHYAAQELGITQIIIDSLMKCGFSGARDAVSSQQVEFVDRLCWAAKKEDIHIHLVHHMRKGEGHKSEQLRPGKHDFRGAGEIVDLVDNAFIVHRNKKKEDALAKGEAVDTHDPDATLEVVKQRHGDWEGLFLFWHHQSGQYMADPGRRMEFGI